MKNIKIKEIHLGEEKQIIHLTNGDIITSSNGWGGSYNNNFELTHQLAVFATTELEDLETNEDIEEFKNDANDYLDYVFNEIKNDGYTIQEIEKYKVQEFKDSFKVLKVVKF